MAIQQIQGKKIFKYDTKKLSKNPNFSENFIAHKDSLVNPKKLFSVLTSITSKISN